LPSIGHTPSLHPPHSLWDVQRSINNHDYILMIMQPLEGELQPALYHFKALPFLHVACTQISPLIFFPPNPIVPQLCHLMESGVSMSHLRRAGTPETTESIGNNSCRRFPRHYISLVWRNRDQGLLRRLKAGKVLLLRVSL